MKRLSGIVILLLLGMAARSQAVAVAYDQVNVLWEAIPNPITIAVEQVPVDRLVVSTDNGILQKQTNGRFIISGLKMGTAHISIRQKTGNTTKLIGVKSFRVKMLPAPLVALGGKTGGEIRKAVLQSQLGLVCFLDGFDIECTYKISKFTVNMLRNGVSIYHESTTGNKFSAHTSAQFNMALPNDVLIFSDVFYFAADHSERKLNDMEFKIIP